MDRTQKSGEVRQRHNWHEVTGLSISSWLTVLVRYKSSYSFRGWRRVVARRWCVLTGTVGSSCLYEYMHSVLCTYTDIEAGVAPAGKKRLTMAASKWEQTRPTPVARNRVLGRRWELYALRRHSIRLLCRSNTSGGESTVLSGEASVGVVNGQSFQPPDSYPGSEVDDS